MKKIGIKEAAGKLDKIIDSVNSRQTPVLIKGYNRYAVLISLKQWNGIEETLYLQKMPRFIKTIKRGMQESAAKMSRHPGW